MGSMITRAGLVSLLVLGMETAEPAGQTARLGRLMQQKLAESEKLLEPVVTGNWAELARRSRALEALTNDPAWQVLKAPEYGRQSSAFLQAARDLVEAAERRDQEAAPLAYLSLTLSCVRCHQYVARARIASVGSGRTPRRWATGSDEMQSPEPAPASRGRPIDLGDPKRAGVTIALGKVSALRRHLRIQTPPRRPFSLPA